MLCALVCPWSELVAPHLQDRSMRWLCICCFFTWDPLVYSLVIQAVWNPLTLFLFASHHGAGFGPWRTSTTSITPGGWEVYAVTRVRVICILTPGSWAHWELSVKALWKSLDCKEIADWMAQWKCSSRLGERKPSKNEMLPACYLFTVFGFGFPSWQWDARSLLPMWLLNELWAFMNWQVSSTGSCELVQV